MTQSLQQLLQSVSDVLHPEDLGKAPVNLNSSSADGDTPLHVMMWRRDHGGARLLIQVGADVNAVGDMGETPLHVAVAQQDTVMVELLLRHGAKDDVVSEFGDTPREQARKKGGPTWEASAKTARCRSR